MCVIVALEADDAAQTRDQELGPVTPCAHCAFLDGLIVERGQPAAQDVYHSCSRLRSQVCLTEQVLVYKRRVVAKAHSLQLDEGSQHTPVVADVVGYQEVDVFGCPDAFVGGKREPADNDKVGILGDHRGDGDVEFGVERGHRAQVRALPLACSTARSNHAAWAERCCPCRSSSSTGVSAGGVSARRFSSLSSAHSASWPGSSKVRGRVLMASFYPRWWRASVGCNDRRLAAGSP